MQKFPMPADDSDLWGFNPAGGRLYTQNERRTELAHRGRGGFQNTLPQTEWDGWFDAQHTNRVAQTMGMDPNSQNLDQELMAAGQRPGVNQQLMGELGGQRSKTYMAGSAPGSSQLRGFSSQSAPALLGLQGRRGKV